MKILTFREYVDISLTGCSVRSCCSSRSTEGQTTVPEAARHYDLTQQEIERWMDDTEAWMENVLKASPTDIGLFDVGGSPADS